MLYVALASLALLPLALYNSITKLANEVGVAQTEATDFGTYDFVIVGAGSAGCVLANSLSANGTWNVLVIEAGGEPALIYEIPGTMILLLATDHNWGYVSTPQNNSCQAMRGRSCTEARGRALGGTSSINGVFYGRGHPAVYDVWEELGNTGWSYSDLLHYFVAQEHSQIDGDSGYHGENGPLNVAYQKLPSVLQPLFFEGLEELGLEQVDYNGKQQIGYSAPQNTILDGKRVSSYKAFLAPVMDRPNLNVVTNALVTKLLLDGNDTVGVEFVKAGKKYSVNVDKEVILSAGAFNTPQLLMLSGIGPKEELERLEIDEVADLPVGKGLLDHAGYIPMFFSTNYTETTPLLLYLVQALLGVGHFTSIGAEVVAFIRTNDSLPEGVPDIELLLIPPLLSGAVQNTIAFNTGDELANFIGSINLRTTIQFYVGLMYSRSSGNLTLSSKNPTDFPLINSNQLSDPADVEALYNGFQFVMNLTQTEAFRSINATYIDPNLSACAEYERLSKDYWYCHLRQAGMSYLHPGGSAKMGPDNDTSAVVTPELKVRGIGKLRVVDASEVGLAQTEATDFGTYDFVIVGAGSAGCVLANVLSANGTWNILVIEAGGEPALITEIPSTFLLVQATDNNWGYLSIPQNSSCQ
ncbi:glucose dehydrogenase, partial [Rhyzopertha dominica]